MKATRTIVSGLGALAIALLLAGPVHAQGAATPGAPGQGQGGQRGGGRGVGLATLSVSAIDSLVTLTADQKTKIEAIQAALKKDSADAAGDQTKMRELRTKATADINAVFTPEQAAKLKEVMPSVSMLVQSRAVPVSVLADLKLTKEQWTKINAAAKDANDKIQALAQADRREKRPAIVADFKTAVEALLTADQKTIIEKAPKPAGRAAGGAPAPNNN